MLRTTEYIESLLYYIMKLPPETTETRMVSQIM